MLDQLERLLAPTLTERFERLDSPAIADAQGGMRVLNHRIRSLVPGCTIAGPAFTVRPYPGSIMTVIKAMMAAPPDSVLVVDADGALAAGGLLGELLAEEARQRGLKGIVIDGAVRDRRGLREIGFPTFAAGVTPRLGTNLQLGITEVPISCGGVAIQPGDWIFGDDDGVVAIAVEDLDRTVAAAEAVVRRDREMAIRVANGESLADMLGLHRFMQDDQPSISVMSRPEARAR